MPTRCHICSVRNAPGSICQRCARSVPRSDLSGMWSVPRWEPPALAGGAGRQSSERGLLSKWALAPGLFLSGALFLSASSRPKWRPAFPCVPFLGTRRHAAEGSLPRAGAPFLRKQGWVLGFSLDFERPIPAAVIPNASEGSAVSLSAVRFLTFLPLFCRVPHSCEARVGPEPNPPTARLSHASPRRAAAEPQATAAALRRSAWP